MTRSRTARFGLLLPLAVLLAACATAGPSPSPTPLPPTATPTPVPGEPGSSAGAGGGIGGGGIVNPGDPNADIFDGQATMVVPMPGQRDPHPVNVQGIRPTVDGSKVQVELRWWSGVAPCNVLDKVTIERADDDRTITLTAIEGHGPEDVVCIEIAQLTATIVDLGELPAGSWTIRATGDAAPVTVEIS